MKWTERQIAAYLARVVLQRKCLVMVPNCQWTGHECDLLAVTMDLRVIDCEIKVSRADFKADTEKSKWWRWLPWEPGRHDDPNERRERLLWPGHVWKHYYVLPREIWTPELAERAGSAMSGILLIRPHPHQEGRLHLHVERRATPNRQADRLPPAAAVDIARLASFRMWDALDELHRLRKQEEVTA